MNVIHLLSLLSVFVEGSVSELKRSWESKSKKKEVLNNPNIEVSLEG